MVIHTRRTFLKEVSAAAAFAAVGGIPARLLWGKPADLLALAEPDEALLRELALVAVDTARAAGASFADVRVAAGRQLSISASAAWGFGPGADPTLGRPEIKMRAEYGVRAIVDGAWGFAGGSELTADAVSEVARLAVGRARGNRPRRPRTLELAPVPGPRSGSWETPIERDPFEVPFGEQADVLLGALAQAGQVKGVDSGVVNLSWTRNVRVFASSERGLTVQRLALAMPGGVAWVRRKQDTASAWVPIEGPRGGPFGYEVLTHADLNETLRAAAERAVYESKQPLPRSVEVGRYDFVFAPQAAAFLLSRTLVAALNAPRVLGYQANTSGTSFAAPPADILGQYKVAGPLITVRADRTRARGAATVGWDDEGVPAGEHTLVRDGIIVDYLTDRQTAAELGALYAERGMPAGSRGCASGAGQTPPAVRMPNLTLEPGTDGASLDDLIGDIKRGFYVEELSATSDQQVLNTGGWTELRMVRQIRDGKLGGRVKDLAFQFITPSFWNSVDAIGGAATADDVLQVAGGPADPLQMPMATVRAVPVRVRNVNVLNYGRRS